MIGINLTFIHPPIPLRSTDWEAVWSDFECDYDHSDPVGTGATPEEAIADLIDSTFDTEQDDGRIQAKIGFVEGDGLGGIENG